MVLVAFAATAARGEEPPLQPGEAFATRFSGIAVLAGEDGAPDITIDPNGVVGSIVDIRAPGSEPHGTHWLDEPQRAAVTAGEVGQVFGIAIDDADPASIYLTATAAFGLHRTSDNADWMPGMWGPGGGPGTVWRLDPDNDYAPEAFAEITLNGRANSGASLGNIAYDRWNKQLFVSDLETGMIFRLDAETGEIVDHFDHGVDGRAAFIDAPTGEKRSLPLLAFAPGITADVENCDTDFSSTPECWNIADFRRRVWGLGLFPENDGRTIRLYYAIWGSDPMGGPDWLEAGEERKNSLWSVALRDDGGFEIESVRREVILPDFDEDGMLNGAAVTDLAFSRDGTVVLAERGGMRNLGLDGDRPFATPQISRVLQYRRRGITWQFIARFDVGFYDRQHAGPPFIRANAAGGVDYGYAYTEDGRVDLDHPDAMVWATGDALCSSDGPCHGEGGEYDDDDTEVHGLQGTPRRNDAELVPAAAREDYPDEGAPYAPDGPAHSYLIDLDINIDASGRQDARLASRDDTSMIGDVEVFRSHDPVPEAPASSGDEPLVTSVEPLPQVLVPEPPGGVVEEAPDAPSAPSAPEQNIDPNQDPQLAEFHQRFESGWHDRSFSAPVHDSNVSHNRIGSGRRGQASNQTSTRSRDNNEAYRGHVEPWSHYRPGSHARRASWRYLRNRRYRALHSRWRSAVE